MIKRLQSTVLENLIACSDRIAKLAKNISKLYDVKDGLAVLSVCSVDYLRDLIDQIASAYEKEIALKRILIEESIFEVRLGHAERVCVLATWIHEPYLDDSFTGRLKPLTDIYKKK